MVPGKLGLILVQTKKKQCSNFALNKVQLSNQIKSIFICEQQKGVILLQLYNICLVSVVVGLL